MLVVSLLGRVPGYFLVNFAGDRLARGETGTAVVVLAVLVVVAAVGYFGRTAILRWVQGAAEPEP